METNTFGERNTFTCGNEYVYSQRECISTWRQTCVHTETNSFTHMEMEMNEHMCIIPCIWSGL